MTDLSRARAAKQKVAAMLADRPGVNGVGITRRNGKYGVKVNCSGKNNVRVPRQVGGVPVFVEVVGRITKQGA